MELDVVEYRRGDDEGLQLASYIGDGKVRANARAAGRARDGGRGRENTPNYSCHAKESSEKLACSPPAKLVPVSSAEQDSSASM